jgi:L-fucose isomerase-like protein
VTQAEARTERSAAGRFGGPIRVGLLTPYFAFFEERFPTDFRSTQAAYASRLADGLREAGLEVTPSGLVDGPESAAAARSAFEAADVQVIAAASTMAAPPSYGSAALEGFDGPIVVWDDRRAERFEADLDEVEATRGSSLLGSIMLANILGREGRRYLTVSSVDGAAASVARAVVGAAAAASLRGARLGLLGGTIAGYRNVVLEHDAARQLGIELVTLDGEAIGRALDVSEHPDDAPLPDGLEPVEAARPLLDRSLRVHRFLSSLVAGERLDALALNCHSDVLRFGETTGVVGCLASTLLWSVGVPIACTGDGVTAVALMLAARIAGSAQYCEGYGIESATGELLVSSCGMADMSLRPPEEPAHLFPNELYPGRHGLGIATRFTFDEGPATIAGFAPPTQSRPGRLVVSAGRLTGRGFEHLNGPSGTITFDVEGAGRASAAWIDAGPAHHLALMRGDRREELRAAAAFLDLELIDVGLANDAIGEGRAT